MQLRLTAVIPRPLNSAGIKLALIEGMRDVGVEIRENFEDTTRTWSRKPVFDPAVNVPKVGMDEITVETTTEDQRYGWINSGTGTHVGRPLYPIKPVNAKKLAFPSQFIPKTFPGVIGSGAGFSGPVDRFENLVMHPGIEPRKFDKEIAAKNKNNFKNTLEKAMKIARRASGHAIP